MVSDNIINICLATDKKYLKYAGAVIASILKNANIDDELSFYVIGDGLNASDEATLHKLKLIKNCHIEYIFPDISVLPKGKIISYLTRASLFRLQIADLLPKLQRIIYLDCDVVVLNSLKELWSTDLGNNIIAGAGDYNSGLNFIQKQIGCEETFYINSGVILFDLEKCRNENVSDKFIEMADKLGSKATLFDQDVINATLKGKIKLLPLKWNLSTGYFKGKYDTQFYTDEEIANAVKSPVVVHFTGKKKPWSWHRSKNPYWFEYYNALRGTSWQSEIFKGLIKKIFFPCKKSFAHFF